MSDLISRSKVISVLEQLEEHNLTGKMYISNAIYLLNNQPTAYDIDKVIEELEMEMKASSGYSAERVSAFSRAIEIVKQGGVSDDDVCEWKMDNVGADIGCRSDLHHTGYVNRTYCPYCGKKIRVVERYDD